MIDNAIKYGEPGNTVYVSVRNLGNSVEISVEDENRQIETKEYNSIFKRFYMGSNSKDLEGAGIGLYLSADIIEKQGGYISVRPGKIGNRFSIFLFWS